MPHYDLDAVRNAAKRSNIEYRGRNVRRDIDNLGYELKDVVQCLISLTEADFHKTHDYGNGIVDDAYRIDFPNPNADFEGQLDALYVKFCLIDDHLLIDLASFHPHR